MMSIPKLKLMRILFAATVAALWVGAPSHAETVTPLFARGYTVLPAPQQVNLQPGDFEFGNGWKLELGPGVNADDVAVESLKDELATRYGIQLGAGRRSRNEAVMLQIQPGAVEIGHATDKNTSAVEQQSYRLELSGSGIRITANADPGLLYGVDTLVQLVKPEEQHWVLPNATITDWPDLELRNIYWDDNHHLDRLDVLKKALRQAAFYKINGVIIKLNSHFQFASAPAIVGPYALSPEQLQELTDYGLKYHVQLIPYLDGPGHISFILKHPEYQSLREFPDSNYELCSTNPGTYKLLEGMYTDLLNANKGVKYFQISEDEPYYVGLADNSQCDEARLTKQLGTRGKVLARFMTKTSTYLHDRGRTVIFWGYEPLVPGDVPSLPSFMINGLSAGPEYDKAFKARGIRQMIETVTQGVAPLFPHYYFLSGSELYNPIYRHRNTVLETMFNAISFSPTRQDSDLMGTVVAGWGDEGLHPTSFWLGYATGPSWAWHPGTPSPDEAASDFYRLFYGKNMPLMARTYQLMSTQAEFWDSSWDEEPSSQRKPIFGNSNGIYKVRRPTDDQTLPLPPVPQGKYLRLPFDWGKENAKRVKLAQDQVPANTEIVSLLHQEIGSTKLQRYNLEVFLSIAGLYHQNLQMIEEMSEIDDALKNAQTAAANVQFNRAVAALDIALDIAQQIKHQRNIALHNAVETWYKSWFPRVEEANGRRYLSEVDDVKDHLPVRTVDMSYLVYRELILPLGQWFNEVEAARNQYATDHSLPARHDKLNWKDYKTLSH
ncbi:MAG: glycoside hydrolase family 20 zincin-like fold domain-containing protein [Terriglobia bacterium]